MTWPVSLEMVWTDAAGSGRAGDDKGRLRTERAFHAGKLPGFLR